MVKKIRNNYFRCYFYENNVLDVSFAKRIVWVAKNAIFSRRLVSSNVSRYTQGVQRAFCCCGDGAKVC